MITSFSSKPNAASSFAIPGNSDAFGFTMDPMHRRGGAPVSPRLSSAVSIRNLSMNFCAGTGKLRSKRSCSCKADFPASGTGWRTKSCGAQKFTQRNAQENSRQKIAPHLLKESKFVARRIFAHAGARLFRSAEVVAHSPTLETRRNLSEAQNQIASRNDWRSHHRVVPAMSALIR